MVQPGLFTSHKYTGVNNGQMACRKWYIRLQGSNIFLEPAARLVWAWMQGYESREWPGFEAKAYHEDVPLPLNKPVESSKRLVKHTLRG